MTTLFIALAVIVGLAAVARPLVEKVIVPLVALRLLTPRGHRRQ